MWFAAGTRAQFLTGERISTRSLPDLSGRIRGRAAQASGELEVRQTHRRRVPDPKRLPDSPDNVDMDLTLEASAQTRVQHETTAAADAAASQVQRDVLGSLELLNELYDYNHWVYATVRPYLGASVCEVGAGIGNFIQFALNHDRVVAVEPFRRSFEDGRQRYAAHANVRYVNAWLHECPREEVPAEGFDSVVSLKVLESLDDDVAALTRMRMLCRRGGHVVIFVAAHMSAYGTMDQVYGHLRRYNRRGLASKFAEAGLRPVESFYANLPGYFGWWWHSRVRKSREIPPGAARFSNKLIPLVGAVERILRPPFGQSLVMVGTPA